NSAYPHPPLFGNPLLSFSMTKACVKTSGTSTTNGASVLFFGFHCSLAILEPSGNGWPLPGMPALYASIMAGLATITLSTSSVRAEETTAQSSYPLKSEKAIPLGDAREYLSCAPTVVPPRNASAAVVIAIVNLFLRFMDGSLLTRQSRKCPRTSWRFETRLMRPGARPSPNARRLLGDRCDEPARCAVMNHTHRVSRLPVRFF